MPNATTLTEEDFQAVFGSTVDHDNSIADDYTAVTSVGATYPTLPPLDEPFGEPSDADLADLDSETEAILGSLNTDEAGTSEDESA